MKSNHCCSVQVLFATETFSTGLNMPARTVAFAGVRKFDGATFRNLSGGEYTQMSGRAGRRGLDATGTVILLCDAALEAPVAKDIVRGRPDPLRSAFRLTYPSLLSVLRLDNEQVTPNMLISRSFRQWQAQRALPALRERLAEADAAAKSVTVDDESAAAEVYDLLEERGAVVAAMRGIEAQPQHAVPFLQPGRLVRLATASPDASRLHAQGAGSNDGLQETVRDAAQHPSDADVQVPTGDVDGVWAAVLGFERMKSGKDAVDRRDAAAPVSCKANPDSEDQIAKDAQEALNAAYIVDAIANVAPGESHGGRGAPRQLLPHDSDGGTPLVVAVPLSQLVGLAAPRIVLPKDVLTQEARYAS